MTAPWNQHTGDERPITPAQQDVLDAIVRLTKERQYPPTVREIADYCGLASTSTVHTHLSSLVRDGWITNNPKSPRTIVVLNPDAAS